MVRKLSEAGYRIAAYDPNPERLPACGLGAAAYLSASESGVELPLTQALYSSVMLESVPLPKTTGRPHLFGAS
ncbi:MAG: hypothetical protein ACP5R4_11265 [Armatimonadota bacterium]